MSSRRGAVLLLDNYDSYTWNVANLIAEVLGRPPLVVYNDAYPSWPALVEALPPLACIVLSPGPGSAARAADFGLCAAALASGLPVLGVCLGHQGLCLAFGGEVGRAREPMHGRTSRIAHDGTGLFEGVPSPFVAVRYHSLVAHTVPSCLRVTARCEEGAVMAVSHASLPLHGVQFHPESICTEHGHRLLRNFLRLAGVAAVAEAPPPPPLAPPPPPPQSAARRRLLVCEPLLDSDYAEEHSWPLPSAQRVFERLFASAAVSFWLDADAVAERRPAAPRFSYMGCDGGPHAFLLRRDAIDGADFGDRVRASLAEWEGATPERWPPAATAGAALPAELGFRCGFVGHLGYEAWRWLGPAAAAAELQPASEELGSGAAEESALLFADRLLAFDHGTRRLYLLCLCRDDGGERAASSRALGERWLARMRSALRIIAAEAETPAAAPAAGGGGGGVVRFVSDRGEAEYLGDIARIQKELRDGETYEVCLTTAMRCATHAPPPLPLYATLRALNPAPHAAYLRFDPLRLLATDEFGPGGAAVCSSSPERFLRVGAGGAVECRPFKAPPPATPTRRRTRRRRRRCWRRRRSGART